MKNIILLLVAICSLISCRKSDSGIDAKVEGHQRPGIDSVRLVIQETLEKKGSFEWASLSPTLLWTAIQKSNGIVAVGYQTTANSFRDNQLPTINIQDVDWYQTLPIFNFPLPEYRNATYRGFQVEGDSMLPNIHPNDWVLGRSVSNVTEASDNKIYIVVLHDSVLVKKLQKTNDSSKIRLISLNEEYLPIEVNIVDIQELWQVNSKLTFGIDEPSGSNLLKELQQSMEDLKGQINSLR